MWKVERFLNRWRGVLPFGSRFGIPKDLEFQWFLEYSKTFTSLDWLEAPELQGGGIYGFFMWLNSLGCHREYHLHLQDCTQENNLLRDQGWVSSSAYLDHSDMSNMWITHKLPIIVLSWWRSPMMTSRIKKMRRCLWSSPRLMSEYHGRERGGLGMMGPASGVLRWEQIVSPGQSATLVAGAICSLKIGILSVSFITISSAPTTMLVHSTYSVMFNEWMNGYKFSLSPDQVNMVEV